MKNTACLMTTVGMSFLLAGCSSPSRTCDSGITAGSPYRVSASTVEPDGVDQVLVVEFWSMECLDSEAPELAALFGQVPVGPLTTGMLETEAITAYLDALEDRGLLEVRSMPTLTVAAGERVQIWLTEVIDRPDPQEGIEPGDGFFPFEIGERIRFETALDDKGFIHLDLDYRLKTLQGSVIHPYPSVLTTAISTSFVVKSGQSVVLGGQRLPRESASGEQAESALLVIVNARAIAPTLSSSMAPTQVAAD